MPRSPRVLRRFALVCLAVAVGAIPSAWAYTPPGRTERVSVRTGGHEVGHGGLPAATCCSVISADGNHVAFMSGHDGFVPADANLTLDVFVHHRGSKSVASGAGLAGVTERVSVSSDESEAFGESYSPAISADGSFVAFESNATTLVPGDTNFSNDVFVRDLQLGTTERVSLAPSGVESSGYASYPDISGDGRYVAFQSTASDLVPGDSNGVQDVFVHDRSTGHTVRASVTTGGAEATGGASVDPSISADGRYVAFESDAPNLVVGDSNQSLDVFVHDLVAGTTDRVSVATGGVQANDRALDAAISGDGRVVAFSSTASNLVPGDANASADVFVHDRVTVVTQRVSVSSAGAEDPGTSVDPAISADGHSVAFWNVADLVPADAGMSVPYNPATVNVFVHDRLARTTQQVSVALGAGPANSYSYDPTLNADGGAVAYYSFSSNLVADDTNAVADVFVRERGPGLGIGAVSAKPSAGGVTGSGWARFSHGPHVSATDPAADGATHAGALGAELVGAQILQRPEDEDVLVTLELAGLPAPVLGGAPGVVYGLAFTAGPTTYEVRALRIGATGAPPGAPYVGLYRCDGVCSEIARLSGGIGTTGNEVIAAVPLSHLGGASEITDIRAFTSAGEAASGAVLPFDEMDLDDLVLGAPRVDIAVAPAESLPNAAEYRPATLTGGAFSGAVSGSFAAGTHRLWARACVSNVCAPPRSAPL